jgi:crotonobetainyl-CoA:carnitine CoA-transferase CaiB-like acyl-CoA transferase
MTSGPLAGLAGVRVADLSEDIAGAYCSKLLADAGADVVRVEPPDGHALRRWSRTGTVGTDGDPDGALFRFLAAGQTSVITDGRDGALDETVTASDVVVLSRLEGGRAPLAPDALSSSHPELVVVSLTPFGLTGPRRSDTGNEYLLQALSGSLHNHGSPDGPPTPVGGALAQWSVGVYGALGAVTALANRRRTGAGSLVDISALEAMTLTLLCYPSVAVKLPGGERRRSTYLMIPGVEPCRDGYVGLTTITGEQWQTFLAMIERPDLVADPTLLVAPRRNERPDVVEAIHAWTRQRTVAEVMETAGHFRIPAVPVGNGAILPGVEHVVARELFDRNPRGGFSHARPPFRSSESPRRQPAAAPRLGDATRTPPAQPRQRPASAANAASDAPQLPLAGVRVLDLTAFLAGPFATQYLATAGADVIKVESVQRPDPMRFSVAVDGRIDQWYEQGNIYLSVNLNKRGITLNLSDQRGRDLLLRLAATSDVVIENYTPRVMEQFGFTYDALRAVRPDIIMVRMPGFGLEGPWRDRPGFAASMEMLSGMAWVTGYAGGLPNIPGICDPVAGGHAAFAVITALEHRACTGRGQHIELAMVDMAANLISEQIVEYEVYGNLMRCEGSRAPTAAPQGVYTCEADDTWLALSVTTDAEWSALRRVLGDPEWARDPRLSTLAGRRGAHDAIDAALAPWFAARGQKEALALLAAAGVPAEPMVPAYDVDQDEQMAARSFWEVIEHPLVGEVPYPAYPMRFSGAPDRWFRRPAPTLGQHNDEVLGDELGLSRAELEALRADKVIGDRPAWS